MCKIRITIIISIVAVFLLFLRLCFRILTCLVILCIFKYFSNLFASSSGAMFWNRNNITAHDNDDDIPSIYVNKELLQVNISPKKQNKCLRKYYEIKDKVYLEDDYDSDSDDEDLIGDGKLFKFELDAFDDVGPVNYDKELNVTLEEISDGYLVNGTVYLTFNQWNTISRTDLGDIFYCATCDDIFETGCAPAHARSAEHDSNMKLHKPLARYDMCIIRKISNEYHCGVCNYKYDEMVENDHLSGKNHGWNLHRAINKAIEYIENNNTKELANDDKDKPKVIINDDNDNPEGIISDNTYNAQVLLNGDMDNAKEINNDDNDNAKVFENGDNDDTDFKGKNPINIDLPISDSENIKSYSEVAKSTSTSLCINVTHEKRNIKIRFENWHTVIQAGLNEIYCMVCEQKNNLSYIYIHCMECNHLEKLSRCTIVESYEDLVIRKINDKFNHCSKCNSLHYVYESQNHISVAHSKHCTNNDLEATGLSEKDTIKPKENEEEEPRCDSEKSVTTNESLKDKNVDDANVTNINENTKQNNETDNINKEINGIAMKQFNNEPNTIACGVKENFASNNELDVVEIDLFLFGCRLVVRLLSYNMICKREANVYYCGLCDVVFMGCHLMFHINLMQHTMLMKNIMFLPQYSVNLTRCVRNLFHCTVCNLPVPPLHILQHNIDPMHIHFLVTALTKRQVISSASSRSGTPIIDKLAHIANHTNDVTKSSGDIGKSLNTINENRKVEDANRLIAEESSARPDKNTKDIKIKNTEDTANLNVAKLTDNVYANIKKTDLVDNLHVKESKELENKIRITLSSSRFDISVISYNTIVPNGDGAKFCAVCDARLSRRNLFEHVNSEMHTQNIGKHLFLEDYEHHLLRQLPSKYHCATCNVLIGQTQLENHLQWPTHTSLTIQCRLKKYRHRHKKSCVPTQKEQNFIMKELPVLILFYGDIVATLTEECQNWNIERTDIAAATETGVKLKWENNNSEIPAKILTTSSEPSNTECLNINIEGKVFKVDLLVWNGLREVQGGYKCILCQSRLIYNIKEHLNTKTHIKVMTNDIERLLLPALMRKINERLIHCIVCNEQLLRQDQIDHVATKCHKKKFKELMKNSKNNDNQGK